MNVHILQHVPFEGIGSMEPWLVGRGARISSTRFFEAPVLPELDGLDLIIAMGGPMSVNDEASLPWLVGEKRLLREAIARGVAVLGVCLGAQLIASALGARVYAGQEREIGWFDIEPVASGGGHFAFPSRVTVFHWHGETFDLPPGAAHLARSEACAHQAFQIGHNVIGLQFHLETTPESARSMVHHGRDELIARRHVQTEEVILGAPTACYEQINRLMDGVLTFLTRHLA